LLILTVQGVGRYPTVIVAHRQASEGPIFLFRMESVGISLGKRAGIGNSRNGTEEHSSLSFYSSKRGPDQI
jgi:hypothetical protein